MAATQSPVPGRQRCLAPPTQGGTQRGVYALEWAIIFPVFFALLYAILSYGLTFLVRESMQYAVEEGARAALRYPSASVLAGAATPTWGHRKTEAWNAIKKGLFWPSNPQENDFEFTVCSIKDSNCLITTPLNTNIVCNADSPCLILVRYSIDNYNTNGITPEIPGLGLILPKKLQADASILADRRML